MSLLDAIHDTPLSAAIGRTPLVRLRRFEPRVGVEIYAKLEARNAGGSVKDRAALSIILEGERTGALGAGRILLDATSGNTGIAYAMQAPPSASHPFYARLNRMLAAQWSRASTRIAAALHRPPDHGLALAVADRPASSRRRG